MIIVIHIRPHLRVGDDSVSMRAGKVVAVVSPSD
jgi:hypothetical protein